MFKKLENWIVVSLSAIHNSSIILYYELCIKKLKNFFSIRVDENETRTLIIFNKRISFTNLKQAKMPSNSVVVVHFVLFVLYVNFNLA